jgi:NADH-quinone oxidoreductase subunit C
MSIYLSGQEIAKLITAKFPEAVVETGAQAAIIKSEFLLNVMDYLKNCPDQDFNLLVDITAVDYFDYFEIIYRLTSLKRNTNLALKVRCYDRSNPEVASLINLWKGANYMEREVFDLMGIKFTGHPNLKRIFLWDGFKGHPLRKDFV